jgi:hypothetical protein
MKTEIVEIRHTPKESDETKTIEFESDERYRYMLKRDGCGCRNNYSK